MSAFQRFLQDFAAGNTLDVDSQDSQEYEDVECSQIYLPGLDETQIVDEENETCEVVLYLKTRNGKVEGAESTPFVLPNRWTYQTLWDCVKQHIKRVTNSDGEVDITQLYYKKNKGKTVVRLTGDGDILALLNEYPLTYKSGKRKKETTMYLAVDLQKDHASTPRRSPRLRERTTTFDIYVHGLGPDLKVLGHADVLHKVCSDSSIEDITCLLRTYEDSKKMFNPAKGLYWLRKGKKQLVSLKSKEDLQTCKDEYKGDLHLACHTVSLEKSSGSPDKTSNSGNSRKRRLDMGSSFSGKSAENESWNDIHVGLVKDLEKRGTLWRYGTKHLKLWTDEIISGNSAGINEEPVWEEHIDAVSVPPKMKKSPTVKIDSPSSTNHLLQMMFMQQQQRSEMMQTALLACLSNNSGKFQFPGNLSAQPTLFPEQGRKELNQLTTGECLDVLRCIGLPQHCSMFESNQVDGPMLEALIHPHLGQQILLSLGVNDTSDRHRLVTELYRLKAHGYICNRHIVTNSSS